MSLDKLSLNSFLEGSVTDLPDRPTRAMLPAGKHVIQVVNYEAVELGEEKKEALQFKCKAVQTLELVNPSDTPLPPNEEIEFTFMTDNALGLGSLKEFLMPIAPPGTKMAELLPAMVGQQFVVTTKVRKYKSKKSGEEMQSHDPVGGLAVLG